MCACVHACVSACVRACVRVCVIFAIDHRMLSDAAIIKKNIYYPSLLSLDSGD